MHFEKMFGGYTATPVLLEEPQARLASELMRQMAIVAAVPDGYDEAGRQKLRLMTPQEVVDRATAIASLAWAEYGARGWLAALPVPDPGE